jgi:hypothetical protein
MCCPHDSWSDGEHKIVLDRARHPYPLLFVIEPFCEALNPSCFFIVAIDRLSGLDRQHRLARPVHHVDLFTCSARASQLCRFEVH